jgi:hypothetical protein
MQLQIIDGYITGFAILGGFVDGVDVPDNALDGCDEEGLSLGCYRWEDSKAVLDEDKLVAIKAERQANEIRARRDVECFALIDRSPLWYSRLTEEQTAEL